jgi:GntR family transcriptional regulator
MTVTDAHAGLAPYERIAEHFRGLIGSGDLAPGDRLPTVREVAAEWSVARQTADKAMATLRADGLVTSAGRNGTVVRGSRAGDPAEVTIAIALPDRERVDVASTEVVEATGDLATQLGLPGGTSVVVVRLRRSGTGDGS